MKLEGVINSSCGGRGGGADEAGWVVKEPVRRRGPRRQALLYIPAALRARRIFRAAPGARKRLALDRCVGKILEILLAHTRCAQRAGAGWVVSCEESGGYGV